MALAAAWFETGEDVDEGKVLRWVESLPPPSIAATEATNRIHVVSYVPVNDIRVGRKIPDGINLDKLKKAGLNSATGIPFASSPAVSQLPFR